VFDEQRWLMGLGYDGRVILVESYLDAVEKRRNFIDIQTE